MTPLRRLLLLLLTIALGLIGLGMVANLLTGPHPMHEPPL